MSTSKTIQIMSIPADESRPVEVRTIDSGLDSMQNEVSGLIECIQGDGYDMWANEEARLIGLPTNNRAIRLMAAMGPVPGYGYLHHIVGDVFLTGTVDDEGETLGLDDPAMISAMWAALGIDPAE